MTTPPTLQRPGAGLHYDSREADTVGRTSECIASELAELVSRADLSKCLEEAALYGSLVRGDFDPNISDIDIFLVISDRCPVADAVEEVKKLLVESARKCIGGLPVRGVDVAWCLAEELGYGCQYKFLTLYRMDFEENHIIAWGRALHKKIPWQSWSEILCGSLERVKTRLREWSGKPELLPIAAGEAVKLALAASGYRGPWTKHGILRELEARGWKRALGLWRKYIEGSRVEPVEALQTAQEALRMVRNLLGDCSRLAVD
ncbi:MAG: nucleotidyltransferase domain-containing protein [Desulfurococcales archaeon]|nr:nucleotidyltransferase domain-containing protein [Desulfurococcales archaeon]